MAAEMDRERALELYVELAGKNIEQSAEEAATQMKNLFSLISVTSKPEDKARFQKKFDEMKSVHEHFISLIDLRDRTKKLIISGPAPPQ
ncbi:MAG: hypothetical protein ACOVQN_00485 [Exiguobacterium sp.]